MSDERVGIVVKGKLFDADVSRRIKNALNEGIERMAFVTENRVKAQLYKPGNFPESRHGVDRGDLRRSISGELIGDLSAQIDAGEVRLGANLNYASWIEGTSARNAASGFKGYKMFENARKQLEAEDKGKYFDSKIRKSIE